MPSAIVECQRHYDLKNLFIANCFKETAQIYTVKDTFCRNHRQKTDAKPRIQVK